VVLLDKLGCAVSTGSACASGKEQPSHVLLAMGCDPSKTDRMLRISAGWETTETDWHALRDAIETANRSMDRQAPGDGPLADSRQCGGCVE
jgi:cysteine desulfurase